MPRPLSLLLVEDSPEDAELLVAELARQGFAPTALRVQTGQDLERGAVDGVAHDSLDSKSLMQASSSFSFTGLVMNPEHPASRIAFSSSGLRAPRMGA